ncbi:MATE family efflux transporter [Edaphobacillus lindanitolerans]|uniref:Probable multidrug resistance protein NorM n=1 Tax=Edaphobacillus lindanitolerans TaxID=550447 RepID=A0A1U7PP62_9BACI|nr:MATE family efflux transporter [Edaphobacillus lindanitolerans]SIT80720.1 multidrug resistance protein, MATE family [Edaphobacillus lindanitolerans]
MAAETTFSAKIPVFGKIVLPILVTQVAMYMITFFDILMTGRYDSAHLAGVTIGSSFWNPVYTGLAGILLSVTPIVAQAIGANRKQDVRPTVQQGLYISIVLFIAVFAILQLVIRFALGSLQVEPEVREVARGYLSAMSLGLLPLFAYNVFRSFIDALAATRVTMAVTLLSAPINVLFNYLLIFGKAGFPELGGIGAGAASAITYWIVLLIAILVVHRGRMFSDYRILSGWQRPAFPKWKEIILLGVPIGISIFTETSIFAVVTLFMSAYSTETISAHQIALNFTSLLYMIPLSLSMGATILVGQAAGAGGKRDAVQFSWLGVTMAIGFSLISILILVMFREGIASLYTDDQAIIRLAVQFFLFAALFQLSDAIQAPVQGALRGYKDVNVTFIMAIISYWVIGLPVGYALANLTDLGPYGYWIGLITGLTAGAVTLSVRLILIQRKKALE